MIKLLCTISLSIFLIVSCSENHIKSKPKDETYIIDVAYVFDDALPTFDSNTLLYLFGYRIPYLTKQILGYDVFLNVRTGMTEKEFYNATKRVLKTNTTMLKDSYVNIFDIKGDELKSILSNRIDKEHSFRLDYLFDGASRSQIVEQNAVRNIRNIRSIYNMKLKKREILFQNEYPFINREFYWAMIARGYRSADMIIVNMPIASLNKKMNIKSIADYGFVDRLVSENRERRLGVGSVVTTYPLLTSDSLFNSIRINVDYETQAEIFSYYIVQTIGMMLGGYDVLESEPDSIMNEVVGFQYQTWYSNIKNSTRLVAPYKLLRKYPHSYND